MWQSLAWKEWHEHKWKMAAILTVLLGLMAFVAFVSGSERNVLEESYYFGVFVGSIPLAVFVGLGIAAGEHSRGTMRYLQAVPVPLRDVAVQKLTFGLLSVAIPILLAALFMFLIRTLLHSFGVAVGIESAITREPSITGIWLVDVSCVALLMAGSLVIWAAACGVNRRDEVSAGAVALGIMVAWWVVLGLLWFTFLKGTHGADTARLRAVAAASAPLGFMFVWGIAKGDTAAQILGCQTAAAVHACLVAWYFTRFGRRQDQEVRSPRGAIREKRGLDFLAAPRRFAITSIAWKQFRESGPVVGTGLLGIVGIVAIFCLGAWIYNDISSEELGLVYRHVAVIFGFFIALVAGIGVVLNDLRPNLKIFWRSRPIQPDVWFWTKFVTGLIVVMTAIYAPIGLFSALGDRSVMQNENDIPAYGMAAAQVAVFASAVLLTCLVRHAVYAAILSVAAVYIGVLTGLGVWYLAGLLSLVSPFSSIWLDPTPVQVGNAFVATSIVYTVLAWLAMRYDWGRKSRY
jgi:hypothetical protein